MKRVLDPLRQMGADTGDGDRLPVTIRGGRLHGIAYQQPDRIGPGQIGDPARRAFAPTGEVEVIEPARSRDHTEKMLRAFGCDVETEGHAGSASARQPAAQGDRHHGARATPPPPLSPWSRR